MIIFVKIYDRHSAGRSIVLDVESDETIEILKIKIEEKEGISKSIQRLLHKGNILENNTSFGDCNIEKESTLHLYFNNGYRVAWLYG